MSFNFGTGLGLVFVRSAYGQALAYFKALNLVVGDTLAVAQKFGFPARKVTETDYVFLNTSFLLAAVQQPDGSSAVLSFGPKNGASWPALALGPDGDYHLVSPVGSALFGVNAVPNGITINNVRYFAGLDGALLRQFDPSMVDANAVVVSIDDSRVATTMFDGVVIDVTNTLREIVVSDARDTGAAAALQIKAAIAGLQDSCADFHNIGHITEYTEMLDKLQTASRTIELSLAANADLVSYKFDLEAITALLGEISKTIQETVTLDDKKALEGIRDFLLTLEGCKQAVRSFHVAINSVAVINVPKSLGDTVIALRDFNSEVKCIADHLQYFATGQRPVDATDDISEFTLSPARRAEIAAAIASVNALTSIGSADLNNIEQQAVKQFKDQAALLVATVSSFDSVLLSLTNSLSNYVSAEARSRAQAAVAASQAAAAARALSNIPA
jgi:hypothetical protein